MRALTHFIIAIIGSLVLAAVLAYPLYVVIHPLQPIWRFDKIATRLFQLLALIAVLVIVKQRALTTRHAWGYGIPKSLWRQQAAWGALVGILSMLPISLAMDLLGIRTLLPNLDISQTLRALLAGLGSGLAVGFLEETFFRGLMQGAVLREMKKPWLGLLLVAVIYAALHFLARVRIPAEAVTWHSGLDLLSGVAAQFFAPSTIIDSFLSLTAVGLLLGLVSHWSGSIAWAVGLHAGWVMMMRTTIGITTLEHDAPQHWLISQSDGYTGWLVLSWTLVMTLALIANRQRLISGRLVNR
jgi:hypothetical protein